MANTPKPLTRPTDGQACPCGSGANYELCCGPIIARKKPAANAEQLMRARFSAHVALNHVFLHETVLENQGRPAPQIEEGGESPWSRLVIHSSELGRTPDIATVDFTAWFVENDQEVPHHEKGEFKLIDGEWIYVRAMRLGPAPVKAVVKAGRNDPCPCGSGKKYKHCCLKV